MHILHRRTSLNKKGYPISITALGAVFLYALFGMDRMKKLFAIRIDGRATTNEISIILLAVILMYFLQLNRPYCSSLRKNQTPFLVLIFLYVVIITIGGFNVASVPQFIYAACIFIVPMLLFFPMSSVSPLYLERFIRFFVLVSLVYSLFAIILTTNYALFNGLVGNSVDNYRYYSQYRASMMVGSSITVSYYLNMTLPLSFYSYYISEGGKRRFVSLIAIVLNIAATLVLLSRVAAITSILITLGGVLLLKSSRKNLSRKTIFLFILTVAMLYIFANYDLSRFMNGLNLSGDSAVERGNASQLGLHIFTKYPLFGSGIGRFFERVYENRYITVDGLTGLIDPHNLYVMVLSELGIAGLTVTILLFAFLFRSFSHIKDRAFRYVSNMTLIGFLLNSMGGSHMLNEISFSTLLWIYMGLFHAVSIRDRVVRDKGNTEYEASR